MKKANKNNDELERNTEPSQQTGFINSRNNNVNADLPDDAPVSNDPNIYLDNEGIGDSSLNNDKLTNYTSNHSSDA